LQETAGLAAKLQDLEVLADQNTGWDVVADDEPVSLLLIVGGGRGGSQRARDPSGVDLEMPRRREVKRRAAGRGLLGVDAVGAIDQVEQVAVLSHRLRRAEDEEAGGLQRVVEHR
jgi:hypothetical protein